MRLPEARIPLGSEIDLLEILISLNYQIKITPAKSSNSHIGWDLKSPAKSKFGVLFYKHESYQTIMSLDNVVVLWIEKNHLSKPEHFKWVYGRDYVDEVCT